MTTEVNGPTIPWKEALPETGDQEAISALGEQRGEFGAWIETTLPPEESELPNIKQRVLELLDNEQVKAVLSLIRETDAMVKLSRVAESEALDPNSYQNLPFALGRLQKALESPALKDEYRAPIQELLLVASKLTVAAHAVMKESNPDRIA